MLGEILKCMNDEKNCISLVDPILDQYLLTDKQKYKKIIRHILSITMDHYRDMDLVKELIYYCEKMWILYEEEGMLEILLIYAEGTGNEQKVKEYIMIGIEKYMLIAYEREIKKRILNNEKIFAKKLCEKYLSKKTDDNIQNIYNTIL